MKKTILTAILSALLVAGAYGAGQEGAMVVQPYESIGRHGGTLNLAKQFDDLVVCQFEVRFSGRRFGVIPGGTRARGRMPRRNRLRRESHPTAV